MGNEVSTFYMASFCAFRIAFHIFRTTPWCCPRSLEMCIRDRFCYHFGLSTAFPLLLITIVTIFLYLKTLRLSLWKSGTIALAAVSYTHLDVYKRQVLTVPGLRCICHNEIYNKAPTSSFSQFQKLKFIYSHNFLLCS